ncbi:hypothetical protein WJX73_009406 [Symbiochloris irregularis]|uniref:Uncharacterized protein n=1 Tax=Symbiochloris irregularis TaxID=706552 RepID=A0AAW1PI30_9CHLO
MEPLSAKDRASSGSEASTPGAASPETAGKRDITLQLYPDSSPSSAANSAKGSPHSYFKPRLKGKRAIVVIVLLLLALQASSWVFIRCSKCSARRHHPFRRSAAVFDDGDAEHMLMPLQNPEVKIDPPTNTDPQSKRLIPRIIHQTYGSDTIPFDLQFWVDSWRKMNPGWEIRFYNDAACTHMVEQEFPEYLQAYEDLPSNVERADFFRYMVVLRFGGLYLDIDTECRKPFDELIQQNDTMLAGWERESATPEIAAEMRDVRQRQALQWAFAAAPSHPALRELCDRVAEHTYRNFSTDPTFDTLERTGPGVWTDVVTHWSITHPPALQQAADPMTWSIRMLPRLAWATVLYQSDSPNQRDPAIFLLHNFRGSWKEDARERFPVSVMWSPAFSVLVDRVGQGELQAGEDVGAKLTVHGMWLPSLLPNSSDSPMHALLDFLQPNETLLDIGAGVGLYSLAAAAQGNKVVAFEAGVKSGLVMSALGNASRGVNGFERLRTNIAYNGFHDRIQLHEVALGDKEQAVCIYNNAADPANLTLDQAQALHGYGDPNLHVTSDACLETQQRRMGDAVLDPGAAIGAVHISAPGWEGKVIDGLKGLLTKQNPPAALLIELHPHLLNTAADPNLEEQYSYPGGARGLLEHLHGQGYTDISHAGHACDQPGQIWCPLNITDHTAVDETLRRVPADQPENFILRHTLIKA